MFRDQRRGTVQYVAGVLAVAACPGCATSAAPGGDAMTRAEQEISAPSLPTGACSVGAPRLVASRVAPLGGVEASAADSRLWLRFVDRALDRSTLALKPGSLRALSASRLEPAVMDPAPTFVLTAGDGDAVDVPSREVHARLDARRTVLAWTTGSIDDGLQLRVATVDRTGRALGPTVRLDREGSVIGRPALSVAPSGRGIVAFIESSERGFALVAASLDCGATPPTLAASSEGVSAAP